MTGEISTSLEDWYMATAEQQIPGIEERPIMFAVYGTPQTAGSKKAFIVNAGKPHQRAIVTDDNTKSRSWKDQVAQAAGLAMAGAGRSLYRGPLDVTFTFYRRRPKGHFGSGRNAAVLKASADRWPITKPDVLKLARAAEDALTGVVWHDDAQIVRELLVKEYGSPERCVVLVRPL